MRGVCLDALNPFGSPNIKALQRLGITGYRMEIRDSPVFYSYYTKLAAVFPSALLLGPSTEIGEGAEALPIILSKIDPIPHIIIIGNEPDGLGPSSWSMSWLEYIQLWNSTAYLIQQRFPDTLLCVAGMVGNPNFLESVYYHLDPKPDLVNKHYPENAGEIQAFSIFDLPVIVGEWCWRRAKLQEMLAWERMLEVTSLHSYWFCWSDGMVPGMGLVSKSNQPYIAYSRYKKALAL